MGTAQVQGALWGERARIWADMQERTASPAYPVVFDKLGVGKNTALLDVGCGTGMAAQLAASRGASVTGIDASEASILIARERVPQGNFIVGEMEELPYADYSFDAVTSFNAFQYAADPVNALRQAKRVTKADGKIAMLVWGKKEDCEHAATLAAVSTCLPPPPPGAGGPFALSEPGRVEALMQQAGLSLEKWRGIMSFEYPDEKTALAAICSAGPVIRAIRHAGEGAVYQAVLTSLIPYKTSTGGYRQQNTFRYVIATI